jgi:uncharacterized protein YkwD
MRTLLVLAMLILANVSLANQKLYNKLNKLYETDKNKCLETAKKLMQKKSFEPTPYYFASVIYYDKSKEARNLRGNYLQLFRAVSSAVKFEELSGDQERELVHWDEHLAVVKNRSELLITALNRNDLEELSDNLIGQLTKIESLAHHFGGVQKTDVLAELYKAPIVEKTDKNEVFTKIDGHFYGLPKGIENLASSNIQAEREIVTLINNERIKRQLPPVNWNEDLARASRYHAYDQGSQGYFSHTSNDRINGDLKMVGGTFERIGKFYKGSIKGECIAAGNNTAQATFIQWMNSDGHREIMLDPTATTIGIGYVSVDNSPFQHYWVLATGK